MNTLSTTVSGWMIDFGARGQAKCSSAEDQQNKDRKSSERQLEQRNARKTASRSEMYSFMSIQTSACISKSNCRCDSPAIEKDGAIVYHLCNQNSPPSDGGQTFTWRMDIAKKIDNDHSHQVGWGRRSHYKDLIFNKIYYCLVCFLVVYFLAILVAIFFFLWKALDDFRQERHHLNQQSYRHAYDAQSNRGNLYLEFHTRHFVGNFVPGSHHHDRHRESPPLHHYNSSMDRSSHISQEYVGHSFTAPVSHFSPSISLPPTPSFIEKFPYISSSFLFVNAVPCVNNICQNGGACYEDGNNIICLCTLPWKGEICDEKVDLCGVDCGIPTKRGISCSAALCGQGKCNPSDTYPFYKCDCGDFFSGDSCEVSVNPCSSGTSICENGTCVFTLGSGGGTVSCECDDGWKKPSRERRVETKWGNSTVLMSPPCDTKDTKGIGGMQITLSPGEVVVWWLVFGISLLILVCCCYTLCRDVCKKNLKFFKAVKVAGG